MRKIPYGTYKVSIAKLDIRTGKSGKKIFYCQMKILEGEYKGSMLFMNTIIEHFYPLKKANEFVRALVKEMEEPINVVFKTYKQYGNMLMDVAEAIDGSFEYKVRYGESKGYNTFDIEEKLRRKVS